ncbi:hypothetical protein CF160_00855 [Enterococcus pseudoavium]|nr:hypothetical protein CF160_00855 [Enterococcus pseudoavium]
MNLRGLMKQETTRRLRLIEELYYAKEWLSSEQLMERLNCSLPALIGDVNFLNEEQLPFRITKTKGLYSIDFDFHATIDVVYSYILRSSLEFQIIESLFFEKSRGIQPAAERLNCSFSNMQRYLTAIKNTMDGWGIWVCHRPLRMIGDEAAIRHFYYLFFRESRLSFAEYGFSKDLVESVDQLIRRILVTNQVTNNLTVHFQLMHSFLIGLQRQKQGHSLKINFLESGLHIPAVSELSRLAHLIRRESGLVFDDYQLRECLWPLFSHQLILNQQQQAYACKINKPLAVFYETHRFLLEKVSHLLAEPLSQAEMLETLRLLGNELSNHAPQKHSMEIIQETDAIMLNLIDKKYSRELKKLETVVSDFLFPKQSSTLVSLYISRLIITINNLLQRLVDAQRPIKVLLLSDTSTTHERFWHSIFPAYIKGAVDYEYFETPFILQGQLTSLTQQYDLIITNITMAELVSACPLIAINAYPTTKDFERIQQFINQFDPISPRKERSNELTPTT